ncbi:FKBP-type peptidyl-prolyl cis-trans isomerase [Phenylobacterium sp.]|uniref:FKBP-type peptidyl-prolyl cis-trans isomerase n=1 Tax=Phenylobacterium sp. TaxID=1871053 RepID=UPI0035B41C7B
MRRLILAFAATALLASCGPKPADPAVAAAAAEAKAFMDKNGKEEGVVTLPSGLEYKIVRSGPKDGLRPQETDEVKVHYEGKLLDGKVFDSSYERGMPAAMPLKALIPGWVEALKLMRPGDEWTLYVPPQLGYGDQGVGDIPPNSVLIFRIELIDVLPGPGRIAQG